MSDAALTIWISCGSLLVSACSLVVSVAAYRRSDTLRRLDRLSELSRDIADLRPRLDKLERTIPKALQSRVPPAAVLGHGLRAGADAAAVREPRGQPDEAASVRQAGPNAAAVREPRGQPDEVASKRQAGTNAVAVRESRGARLRRYVRLYECRRRPRSQTGLRRYVRLTRMPPPFASREASQTRRRRYRSALTMPAWRPSQ